MFIKVDDGVYINLDNVFHITWKTYENSGVWVFHAGAGEPSPPGPAATKWLPVQSRLFQSREEAERWLKKVFELSGKYIKDPDDTHPGRYALHG